MEHFVYSPQTHCAQSDLDKSKCVWKLIWRITDETRVEVTKYTLQDNAYRVTTGFQNCLFSLNLLQLLL